MRLIAIAAAASLAVIPAAASASAPIRSTSSTTSATSDEAAAPRTPIATPMFVQFTHRIGEWERPNLVLKELPDDVDIDWVKVWK